MHVLACSCVLFNESKDEVLPTDQSAHTDPMHRVDAVDVMSTIVYFQILFYQTNTRTA